MPLENAAYIYQAVEPLAEISDHGSIIFQFSIYYSR